LILWPTSDNAQYMRPVILHWFPTPAVNNGRHCQSGYSLFSITVTKETFTLQLRPVPDVITGPRLLHIP